METKLTLRLEEKLIEKAKKFAKTRGVSLSRLVADYFKSVSEPQEKIDKSPILSEISGILPSEKEVGKLTDEYRKRIEEKYLGQ